MRKCTSPHDRSSAAPEVFSRHVCDRPAADPRPSDSFIIQRCALKYVPINYEAGLFEKCCMVQEARAPLILILLILLIYCSSYNCYDGIH